MADNVRSAAAMIVQITKLAEKRNVPIRAVLPQELDRLCRSGHHQGVAIEVSGYPYADLDELLAVGAPGQSKEPPLLLLLDHIQDPQNLGSMLRTADAVGVTGVIIPKDRAVDVTAAVVRASAGAAEHVRIAIVTNLHQTMLRLKEEGVRLAGLETDSSSTLYAGADLIGPLGLVIGGEGEGLGKLVRETCDLLIRLPMRGRVASLNAAVAAAVALYEVRRQRG